MCSSTRVEAWKGDTRCTSDGASAGRMGARRSTPACDSQLFALDTSRAGVVAPRLRASVPTIWPASGDQGKASSPGASSSACGRYRNEGSSASASTAPGAVSCGIGITPCTVSSPSLVARSTQDSALCVVPRSTPMA